jgi:hypothetical protein
MQLKFFPLQITKNPSEGLKIPPLPQRIHDKYLKFSEKSLTLDISFHVTSTGNEEKLAISSPSKLFGRLRHSSTTALGLSKRGLNIVSHLRGWSTAPVSVGQQFVR